MVLEGGGSTIFYEKEEFISGLIFFFLTSSSNLIRVEFYFPFIVSELPLRTGILERPILGKTDYLWEILLNIDHPYIRISSEISGIDMKYIFFYNIFSFKVNNHAKICTTEYSNSVYNSITNNISLFNSNN